jgi:hypothetical protein
MPIPSLPASHDLVRLIRPTLEGTTFALLEHLKRRPSPWSYEKARTLAPFAFDRAVPLSALKGACDAARMHPAGRTSTWEVIQLVRAAGAGRSLQCHEMKDGRLQIRQDLSIRVAADFYFVEQGRPSVFWLQPRRGFGLTDSELAMFGALVRMTVLRGDFEGSGMEILDLSAPDGKARLPRTLNWSDLPEVPEEVVTEGIQRVVSAYDAIKLMDIDWDAVRGRGKPKDKPDHQPGLFDE